MFSFTIRFFTNSRYRIIFLHNYFIVVVDFKSIKCVTLRTNWLRC